MLTRLSRLILSGGTSSTPVAVARSPRSAFSALPWCLTPLVRPAGSAAGWTTGMTAAARSLPSAATTAATARSSPTSCGAQHEQRGVVAVHPVLLAARVGRAEVVERDVAVVVDDHAQAVEVAVRDPRRVQRVELLPRRGEHRVGDTLGRKRPEGRAGGRSGDEQRGVGAADPGAHEASRRGRRRVRRASA